MFFWTSTTHTSCYAAPCSLGLSHICHATSQNSLLCWWLHSLDRGLQTTGARKTPQMAKRCPQPRWVCEALGQKAHKKEFFFGPNTGFGQTVGQKNWKYLYAAVWRKSVKGNVLNIFVIERKKGTFRQNPRRTKLLFRACKTLDFPLLKWPFQGIRSINLFQKFPNL